MKQTMAAFAAVMVLATGLTPVQGDVAQTDVPRWMCKMFFWMPCSS